MSALQTEHKPACSQPHLEYCNTFFFKKKQVLKLWCFQIKTPIELCSHTPPRALQQLPCSIISFCTGTEPDQVPVPCCRLSLRARERSRISQAYFSLHTEQLSLLLWNRTPIFFTLHFPVPGAHTLKLTTWHIWSATPPCCLWSGISYRWLLLSSPSLRTPTSSRCWQTCRLERETETMRRSPLNLNNVSTKQLNSSGHWCHRDSLFHLKCAFPHRWTPPALSWTAGGGGSPSFAFQSRFPTPPAVQHCGVGSPPLGQEAKLTWQRTGGTAAMRGDGLVSGFSK